ncbi:hypothetical protein Tco_0686978 [Tanacetum coccineum]
MCYMLRCIQEDGKCRNVIADMAELAPVLKMFVEANDQGRFEIVQFHSELVKLNRMKPLVRTINSQHLDDFLNSLIPFKISFMCVIISKGGFLPPEIPLVRKYLLKRAGLDKNYRSTMRKEQLAAISGEGQETMLVHKLTLLLNTGIQGAARICLIALYRFSSLQKIQKIKLFPCLLLAVSSIIPVSI